MPVSSAMAEQSTSADEPGAPVAKDAIDPELVKLARPKPRVGLVTALGVVLLCGYFLVKLAPDRRFSGGDAAARHVTASDVLAGKVALDSYVTLEAEPLVSHAIRVSTTKIGVGLRVVPARGTGEHLWIVQTGDGWAPPTPAFTGRLRRLDALPFAPVVAAYAAAHPRPVFASAQAARAGFASGKIQTITGDEATPADGDRVALDVVDPDASTLVAVLDGKHATPAAWVAALAAAHIPAGPPHPMTDEVRFEVPMPVATLSSTLDAAQLWATRVEPVTHHYETTWGALRRSGPAGLAAGSATVPDGQIDLVGLYVARGVPDGAYALLTDEQPQDYWYVLPVTIAVGVIGLLFAWALVRAIKRDLLSPPPPTA
jgi:hypothetical protein